MALVLNVMRENLRSRVLYLVTGIGLLLLMLLLMGGGSVTSDGQSLTADTQGLMRVGFAVLGMLGSIVTVMLAMNTIPREFERGTIHLLLVRPVARWQLALAFLGANILTAWIFLALLSIPLFGGLILRGEAGQVGALLVALLGMALNTAMIAGLTTLFSSRMPGAAAAFLGILCYGLGAFGSTLSLLVATWEGAKGALAQAGLLLLPPTAAITNELVKLFAIGRELDLRVFVTGLIYLWVVAGLTVLGLHRREV